MFEDAIPSGKRVQIGGSPTAPAVAARVRATTRPLPLARTDTSRSSVGTL